MRDVRRIVRLARGVRERLGIRHRHPLHALQIAGVDAAVIAIHGELLKQEVNVKQVEVLSDPERHVKTTLRLNTPVLGKRLKGTLQTLQRAVAAGDYVINADETLSCQGMTLNPSDTSATARRWTAILRWRRKGHWWFYWIPGATRNSASRGMRAI